MGAILQSERPAEPPLLALTEVDPETLFALLSSFCEYAACHRIRQYSLEAALRAPRAPWEALEFILRPAVNAWLQMDPTGAEGAGWVSEILCNKCLGVRAAAA